MKNVEKQNVRNDVKSALGMEATASSQLQGSHLRDADDSMAARCFPSGAMNLKS